MQIEIVHYSPEYEKKHIEFASKYWKKERRLSPEYIYWKFRGKQGRELTNFILAVHNQKVIGQLGIIPCEIIAPNSDVVTAQWACDLMIENTYRGKGIAKMLYDYAHKLSSVTLGSDPSPAAFASMSKSGYQNVKSSWKFIYPINLYEVTKLKNIKFNVFKYIPNPFNLFFKLNFSNSFTKIHWTAHNEKTLKHTNTNPYITVNYDQEFKEWRYSSFKNYYSGIDTFINNKGVYFCGYFVDSTYYLTRYQTNSFRDFIKIISYILVTNKGIKKIRVYVNEKYIFNKMLFFGFIKFRTQTNIIFHTVDNYIINLFKKCNFYYTLSDSDENI